MGVVSDVSICIIPNMKLDRNRYKYLFLHAYIDVYRNTISSMIGAMIPAIKIIKYGIVPIIF